MMDQCCGMAEQGCCQEQGQKCYTVYERKCRYANKPVCQTMTKEFCENYPIKQCRYTRTPESRPIPVKDCRTKREKKCWDYEGHECATKQATHNETFTWVNEDIEKLPAEEVEKCHKVTTCNITTVDDTRTRQVPKRVCEDVQKRRRDCKSVQRQQPPYEVPTVSYRIEYKKQCYKVSKPVCRQKPCQYQVMQQQVCPTCMEPNYPGVGCGTPTCQNPGVVMPQGGAGCGTSMGNGGTCGVGMDMCGVCRQQRVTTCSASTTQCENVEQEVCQQVPYRVAVPGTRTVQPPPKWEMKCDWVTDMIPQCRIEYQPEEYTVPVRKCEQGQAEKCFKYEVPKWKVTKQQMNETVSFPTNGCTIVTKNKTHCAEVPTQIDCQERTVTRTVRINKVVCDREKTARYCHRVPYSYCKNVPGQECSMEPRQVCQPSCPKTNYCNSCVQFASTGGFAQCQTPACPNFIGSGMVGM